MARTSARPPDQEANLQEFLALAETLAEGNALFVAGSKVEGLREAANQAPAGTPDEVKARIELARELLRLGDGAGALAEYQAALRIEQSLWDAAIARGVVDAFSSLQMDRLKKLLFRMVVAGMRMGEETNCVARHRPGSCILPIRGDGVHTDRTGAETAMSYGFKSSIRIIIANTNHAPTTPFVAT